jgi:hypothetical protein
MFTHNSKSSQAVGDYMLGGLTAAGRGIYETGISINGDLYKAKAPKGWYMSYIHQPNASWLEAMRIDHL